MRTTTTTEHGTPMERAEYQSADHYASGQPLSRDDREDIGHVASTRAWLAAQELRRRRSDDTSLCAMQALDGHREALEVLAERALLIEVERTSEPAAYSTAAVRRVMRVLEETDAEQGTFDCVRARAMKPAVQRAVGQAMLGASRAAKVA
jgi:hypothetical protein